MNNTLLIVKETRAGETRVSLVPDDVAALHAAGHRVIVEAGAGLAAGFSDAAYQQAGAELRPLAEPCSPTTLSALFTDVDIIVRAKRAAAEREAQEAQALELLRAQQTSNASSASPTPTIPQYLVGALDPFEAGGAHIQAYEAAGIKTHSIDQLNLPADHPMNLLAAMSEFAGRLALEDAREKFSGTAERVLIIGLGTVGQSALDAALTPSLSCTAVITRAEQRPALEAQGVDCVLMPKDLPLAEQQALIKPLACASNIVITSARAAGHAAPLLLPQATLATMTPGTVVIDLALSEGGNVEGSQHDANLRLGNDVLVSNTSGYPKVLPKEASTLWSRATRHFIEVLAAGDDPFAVR